MTNHTYDARKPRGFWNGLLKGAMAGLLIGGLVGSIALLLYAPRSGKRTRAKLQRQGHELGDQTAASVEDVLEQARDLTQQFTHDARIQVKKLEKRGSAVLDK